MSETLAAEPLTRPLADALQHEDAQAASDAAASARRAGRPVVGRASARRSAAPCSARRTSGGPIRAARLRCARRRARSGAGEPSRQAALSATDAALRDAIQASHGAGVAARDDPAAARPAGAACLGRGRRPADTAPATAHRPRWPGAPIGHCAGARARPWPSTRAAAADCATRRPGQASGAGVGAGRTSARQARRAPPVRRPRTCSCPAAPATARPIRT